METMGFDRGEYSTVMALTAMVSMAVRSQRRLR
jgi:DHA1 family multidrug resistance protein-like MFS transporter